MQTSTGAGSLRVERLSEQIQAVLPAIGRPVSLEDSRHVLARDAESNRRRDRRSDADVWLGFRAGSSAHATRDDRGANVRAARIWRSMPSSSARSVRRAWIERPSCHCDRNRSTISENHTRCASPLDMVHDSMIVARGYGRAADLPYSSVRQNARRIGVYRDLSRTARPPPPDCVPVLGRV
jgi:hypothetical protein